MAEYKHLFFDLDHTLWDFETNAKISLTELFQEFSLDEKLNLGFEDFHSRYIHHNQVLWERYEKGFIRADELKWKRMWRTLLDFKNGDEGLAKDLSARYLEILPVQKNLFPYSNEILEYLLAKGYKIHLITNGFERTQWSKVRNSGLDKYISQLITSESSNSLKPAKEIFEYALRATGAELKESIMIGDNQAADIQGAINAGMDSVFVNHINAEVKVQPTFCITHLSELEGLL